MSTISLDAQSRSDKGKGASRRLRRLEAKVPAILYGGEKEPSPIHLQHKEVMKALEAESFYSSVFDLRVDGKVERVILKDIQRHPYKPLILHMDLQRVSPKYVLTKMVPLHFLNEEKAPGVEAGGMVSHNMTQVEVRCQARNLPEYIEVDIKDMQLNDVLHLSGLKLPKDVELATDPREGEGEHDHSVVTIHIHHETVEEPEAEEVEELEDGAEKETDELKENQEEKDSE